MKILETKWLQSISHPPHIIIEDGNKSLSSFIPFCSFGEDKKAMGTKGSLHYKEEKQMTFVIFGGKKG